jgi:phage-related protein/HPt (histidine-containing phosphotransfer) domain-containing protein
MADYDLGTARGKIEIDASGAQRGVADANAAVGTLGSSNDRTAATLQKTGLALAGVGTIAFAAFGVAVNSAADFEKGISAIGAVSGATEEQLDGVREKALQLGADTKFSASEAATAMEELVKAGISVDDVISGAADATVALAAAGEVSLPEAATVAANAMNQFGLSAEELPHVADLIAGAANASAIDVSQFAQSLQQSGAVANLVGVDFEDLTTLIAAMGNAGIAGSDAGTSIKTFLSNLQPTTKKQIDLAKELGLVGGQNSVLLDHFTQALAYNRQAYDTAVATYGEGSAEAAAAQANVQKWQDNVNQSMTDGANLFFDQNGKIKSMTEVSDILGASLQGLTDQEKTLALETLFGSDAIRAAAIVAEGAGDGFGELGDAIGAVSANEVAAERMDNLAGSIEQLKGSIETAMIKAGTPFQDVLQGIVDKITVLVNWFGNLDEGTQKMIIQVALAGAALLAAAGTIAFIGGTALKFLSTMKQLNQALKIGKAISNLAKAVSFLNAAFLANPIVLIIAALVALGVAIFVLYKKSEKFREFVDNLWQTLQKVWDKILNFFKELPEKFKKAFEEIKERFTEWKDKLVETLTELRDKAGEIVEGVINFFQSMPGRIAEIIERVISSITGFIGRIIGFFASLPEKIPYYLGLVIGTVIRWAGEMAQWALQAGTEFVANVIKFIIELPGKLWEIFTEILAKTATFIADMVGKAIELGTQFVGKVIEFITELPGKLWTIFTEVISNTASFVADMVAKAIDLGIRFVAGIIDFVSGLPGKVLGFIVDIATGLPGVAADLLAKVLQLGKDITSKLIEGIGDLGTLVKDIFLGMINGIAGLADMAWEKAKSVAGSIWGGFKKGLGINSPSFIEEAMWKMTDNVGKSLNVLSKQTASIQKVGMKLPTDVVEGLVSDVKTFGMKLPADAATAMMSTSALGLTGGARVAPDAASEGRVTRVEGPLIWIETMNASEEDITQLSRNLWDLSQRESVAEGRRIIAVGV